MSAKKTRQKSGDKTLTNGPSTVPKLEVSRFLEHVSLRAWTDAEKELDVVRQKSDAGQWSRGYVKALEGLLLTFRSNDDKYSYLPKILSNPTLELITNLKNEFSQFSTSEVHGDYDRGYFKALEDFLSLAPADKSKQTIEQPLVPAMADAPVSVLPNPRSEDKSTPELDEE
ncbi:MAG TPA: hypothetical protein VE177_04390 [Candidatus Binatus sp.]|jgi:hypothetical protein|nr:hypothetical protein [Candidatus Binatus sp.]